MKSTIACPRCGHEEHAEADEPLTLAGIALFECSNQCGLRSAFGRLQLRVVPEPHTDDVGRKWLRLRFQHPLTNRELYTYDVDPKGAAMLATNILTAVIL